MSTQKYLIALVGPTASGKTNVAIQLAAKFDTAILSADSRQFYRELNIGVARPTEKELQAAHHFFIADRSVKQLLTAGQFEKEALTVLSSLYKEHDVAIVAGGSGLFINTLAFGADPMPLANEEIRNNLQQQYDEKGIAFLREELKRLDPVYFEKVDQQNPLRLMRAIEVCLITGEPYSSQRKNQAKERPFKTIFIGLDPGREALYQRINQRVDTMLTAGLEAEANSVLPYRDLSALQTVGYQEFFDYFTGAIDYETAVELIKRNSRRYAKRQMTWFRRNGHIHWFNPGDIEGIVSYIEKAIV